MSYRPIETQCMQFAWVAALVVVQGSFAVGQISAPVQDIPTVPQSHGFANPYAFAQTAPAALRPPPQTPAADTQELVAVPLDGTTAQNSEAVRVEGDVGSVSIFARDVDLRLVLSHIADEAKVNIVVGPNVDTKINTSLTNVPLWKALDAILKIHGLNWTEHEEIIYVTQPTGASATGETSGQQLSRGLRGQSLQVFDLNFVSGQEVLAVAQSLCSPSGQAHIHEVNHESTRQTRERLIVEDYPERLAVIQEYLAGVDSAPRQVLIEVHVLQVTLDNDQRHGVNLNGLARIANARVEVRAQGFADGNASPGFMMGLDGNDLNGMIECLQSRSSVRTLAAPKIMVVNGQQARIQIGEKFGYFENTTTQTGTFQSVNFLELGIVLQVLPTITPDGQVMLAVEPKVSGGRVNPDSGLPEEETTEARTTVILPDGKGMIIGGLIKEQDDKKKSWIPWLGDKPIIGKLFNRTTDNKQRVEVIIAITPHIVPYSEMIAGREAQAYVHTTDTHGIVSGSAGPYEPANRFIDSHALGSNPFDSMPIESMLITPETLAPFSSPK